MEFPGTVQGTAARKFAGFTYRHPAVSTMDLWNLDPERLNYADAYPRSVNPPCQPNTKTVDLADYVVKIGATSSDGTIRLQVYVLPNQYTSAKEPLLVHECHVSNALTLSHEYRNEAVRRVFS